MPRMESVEHPPRRKRRGFLRPLGSFSRDGFGGFLPQPPYFSGGPRRGFTLGCPPIGRLHESILVLPHSKKQEGLISPASKVEALRPSRVTHSRHMRLRSELLTWGAGNLSAFWAFARGCDRVMHLQFRAGELGVSLVQVRAKRFEDSRSMRHTEWGQGDTKLLFRGFEITGILEGRVNHPTSCVLPA